MKRLLFISLGLCGLGCGGDDAGAGGGSGGAGGGVGGASGGTVELGGACVLAEDCKPASSAPVGCKCAGQGPTVCVTLVDLGGTCAVESDCGVERHCLDHGSGPHCEAYVKSGASCATGTCESGSTCTSESVCGAPIALGGTCTASEPGPCEPGAYCEGLSGKCVATVPEGGECNLGVGSSGNECGDGFCFSADAAPATCHAPKQEGEACDAPLQCPAGYDCNGVCTRPAAPAQCG